MGVCPAQASTASLDRNASARVDRTPPGLDIKYPPATKSRSATIYGSVSKDTGSLTFNGKKIFVKNNGYFVEIRNVPLPEKKNIFKFEAKDAAGNTTKKTIKIISYWDQTPPVITIKRVEQGGAYDPGVKPEFKVSDSQSDVTQTILLDDDPFVSGTAITGEGKHTLRVKAVDAYDNSAKQSVRFKVVAPIPPAPPVSSNHAPVLSRIADITVNEGETINFNPGASDQERDPLTFTFSGWMTKASRQTTFEDAGVHTVTVMVSDGALTDSQNVKVTVNNVNRPPVLNSLADIAIDEGNTVRLNPTASDPDGDPLTFSCSGWMKDLSYATSYRDAGTHTATVRVSDGKLTDQRNVVVTVNNVNQPPVLDPLADIVVRAGETVVLKPTATDPDGDPVKITFSGWMDSASRATTRADAGPHKVMVTASDGSLTDTGDLIVTVGFCGDAIKNGNEICDEGASNETPNHCNAQCNGTTAAVCGNNIKEGSEGCDDGNKVSGDGCSSICVKEICGDGIIQTGLGEVCEGNSPKNCTVGGYAGTQACAANTCTFGSCTSIESCGDGVKNGPEICDDGAQNGSPNKCNAQCSGITAAACGNNIKESGEACDDGNKISGDGCSAACAVERCGDGIVQTGLGEVCEGNSIKSCVAGGYNGVQSCAANCTYGACALSEFCGDGNVQTTAGEACDDGNKISGDGCSSTCKVESCGDGIVQAGLGEQCDDGNKTAGDGCNASCKNEYCGDSIIQTGAGEVCDSNTRACTTSAGYSGTQDCGIQCIGFNTCTTNLFCGDGVCSNPPETTTSCPSDCPAICGNGIAEPSEQCDDHNTTSGDGCSAMCKLEICGDGITQTSRGEQCDDGNTTNGDGCGSNCQVEQLADTTAPSVPSGLSCSAVSATQIGLSWNASSDNVGVTGYRVYRNSNQIAISADTNYQNTGLTPATTYTYNVAAYDAAGNVSGQSSAVQCATQNSPDTTAPSIPPGLTAMAVSSSQIDLSWTASTDNVGVTGYRVFRNGVQIATATATTYPDTGLTASTACSYTVSAYDAAGNNSAQSASASATTPPPTGDCSQTNIRCVDDTPGATREYSTIQAAVDVAVAGDTILIYAGIYTNSCVISSCGGGNNYPADASLSANVKLKSSGTSANPITIKSAGDGEVIIDAQGSVNYNIYGVSYSYWIIDGITLKDALRTSLFWQGNSSLDLTVKNSSFQGTATAPNYGYGIFVNNSGDAANNNTIILNNTFSLPGAFVAIDITSSYNSLISGNTITGGDYGIYLHNYTYGSIIEKNTLTGNTGDLTGIFIRDDDNFIIRYNLIKGNYGTQHILYQDSSGIGSTGVKILNNTIDCGTTSSTGIKESDTWAETTDNIIYNCFVDIRGVNPANLPSGQPGYNILYDVSGRYATSYRYYWGNAEQWPLGSGNLTSNPLFVSTGTNYSLQSGSPAINAGGPTTATGIDLVGTIVPQGGRADIGSFEYISTASDTTSPSVPQNLTATAVSSTQIDLAWTASTDNVGVAGYRIYRCQEAGCTPTTQIGTSATNSYSDTDLSPSTAYSYTVSAYDAAGNNSAQSASASATTPPPTGDCFQTNIRCVDDTPGPTREYSTIQAAVNASQAGDTVLVYPGTYNESVSILDGKQGTANSPIIIKARYPARKPLNGGDWADTAGKRTVVNAGSGIAGFYNENYTQGAPVSNIIIDGFYILGGGAPSIYGSSGGIFFENDDNIWIRNNVIINNNPYRIYNSNGEQAANIYLKFTDNSLVQNNYLEYSYVEPYITSAFLINNSGANNIAEYNEGYVGPDAVNGSFAYVRVGSNSFIYRYNYVKFEATNGGNLFARFRDDINYTVTNNYFRSTAPQQYLIVHENTDTGLIENHKLNQNTFYYDQGLYTNRDMFGLGYLSQTETIGNIFYSGVNDTNSYAIGRAWLAPSYSVTIDRNVYYNLISLVEPALNGYTETNTLNLNPNINPSTGCASFINNNIYGANLDISNIPYRKCDGAFYSAAGKFGINVVVSDGAASNTTSPPIP